MPTPNNSLLIPFNGVRYILIPSNENHEIIPVPLKQTPFDFLEQADRDDYAAVWAVERNASGDLHISDVTQELATEWIALNPCKVIEWLSEEDAPAWVYAGAGAVVEAILEENQSRDLEDHRYGTYQQQVRNSYADQR